jgi:hypothetical protein
MDQTSGGTVLTANRTTSTVTGAAPPPPSREPSRLLTALPLTGVSLLVTAVLAVAYEAGLLSIALSALLTLLLVAVASVLYLGYRPRRLPATLLGMAMAAAPAVILSTALMTGPAHLGVPITVITTRLAAVGGWWLSLAIMRPLVDRLGTPRMPVWRASLIFAPALIVAGMCAFAWRGGDGATKTAQRFALLFKTEDNAAWVSHAYAMLRNGHLPRTALESEYYTYSSVSSMPGVLADVALRDRPASHTATAYAAIDVTMANELLAIATAGALLAAALLAALVLFDREQRPPSLGIPLLSLAVTGVGASVVAGTPLLLAGHLSLAWADVALVLMALFVVVAIRADSWRTFAPPFAAACLTTYAAAGSWVYVISTPIVFGVLLISLRRSGLQERPGTKIGDGPRVIWLAVGLMVAGVVAAVPQFVDALQQVGLKGLSGALGGVAPVEPPTLAGAVLVGLGVAYVAYRWADSLSLVVTLLMAAASTSAVLVFLTGVLPENTPTYALTKSLYVILALASLGVVALVAQASRSRHQRLLVVGSLVVVSLITTSPTFGSVIKWPTAVSEPDPGPTKRILDLAAGGDGRHRVVCRPSPYQESIYNYLCNRWTAAISPVQGTADFRLEVLKEPGAATDAWAKYTANGFLKGATVGDAAEIMQGQCVPNAGVAGTYPARYPKLAVRVRSFEPKHPLVLNGHVDAVRACGNKVYVVGWAPFTKARESLDVWADGPVKVVRAARRERADVQQRSGNGSLLSPGYVLVLKVKPAQVAKVCVSLDGDTGSILGGSRSAGCSSS